MPGYDEIGRHANIGLKTGEVLEGWLYAEGPYGFLISLDLEGRTIRFVPRDLFDWGGFAGPGADLPTASFRKDQLLDAIGKLGDDLNHPLTEALKRVDQNNLRRLGDRLQRSRTQLGFAQQELELDEAENVSQTEAIVLIMHASEIHRELLDELQLSGVTAVLHEHRQRIREVVSRDTIPLIDAQSSHRHLDELIQLAVEQDRVSETRFGETYLIKLAPTAILNARVNEESGEEHPKKDKQSERSALRLKKIAAAMKITAGGSLTAVNVGVGCIVGLLSALPTLGLGTVAAAVGIATSAYTGLNAASDGLKDLASAIETR
jgi:hypothetical protein